MAGPVQIESPVVAAAGAAPNQKGIQVTERALKRVRAAMAKEGVSPDEGGLRLGVQGGGREPTTLCAEHTYNENGTVPDDESSSGLATIDLFFLPRAGPFPGCGTTRM